MEDQKIIELYWNRDESAITETRTRYGAYCFSIAHRILSDRLDSEECVNDTYLAAWQAIPPARPNVFSAFLGRITRNLSLKKLRYRTAEKRMGGETALCLDEIEALVPDEKSIEDSFGAETIGKMINEMLGEASPEHRKVFVCRYWYFDSIQDIAARFGFGESKVKMILKRMRDELRERLVREGVFI